MLINVCIEKVEELKEKMDGLYAKKGAEVTP
jgi:hypothetical protein